MFYIGCFAWDFCLICSRRKGPFIILFTDYSPCTAVPLPSLNFSLTSALHHGKMNAVCPITQFSPFFFPDITGVLSTYCVPCRHGKLCSMPSAFADGNLAPLPLLFAKSSSILFASHWLFFMNSYAFFMKSTLLMLRSFKNALISSKSSRGIIV